MDHIKDYAVGVAVQKPNGKVKAKITTFTCKFCNMNVSGTNRFAQHLACKKGEVKSCALVPTEVTALAEEHFKRLDDKKTTLEEAQEERSKQEACFPVQCAGARASIMDYYPLSNKEAADTAISMFFFECAIPLHLIDHPAFKTMIDLARAAHRGYKLPNRRHLSTVLLEKACGHCQTMVDNTGFAELVKAYGSTLLFY